MVIRILLITVLVIAPCQLLANDSLVVRVSGMADIVFSHSFDHPPNHQRAYTLQPSRNDEFGLMLGHIAITANSSRVRGRLAFQEGWFTRVNYTGADTSWRFIQEASAGVRIAEGLWLDAGILPSHIGYESMVARDNLVVSRCFGSDYTPYFETGASLTWSPSSDLAITAVVVNGWQEIVDINENLAFGSKVVFTPLPTFTVNWSTYVGNEQPRGAKPLTRFFNNFWIEWKPAPDVTIVGLADLCLQESASDNANKQWYLGFISAWAFLPDWRVALRAEHYADPDHIFVTTPTGYHFVASSASLNVDFRPDPAILLRGEIRSMWADNPLYPSFDGHSTSDTYVTFSTSIALGGFVTP
ncbi:MAG: outer membrane beta-barrel protein [Candidatus Kapabacteria bacterium]|nr:outer membrane beta-barrel protein [Candidatus Kapabacteria bacterium]